MERFTERGVVLKSTVTGESDRIVHVLTENRGLVRAFARGARSPKSRLHAGTAPFTYGEFTFTEKNGVHNVNEVSPRETFYALRLDLDRLTLAQYFCEILLHTAVYDPQKEYLQLFLNSLFVLCGDKKPHLQVKAVFELRLVSVAGFAPALIACDECGEFETPVMYFDLSHGLLYCARCGIDHPEARELPLSVVTAMRHIVFSEPQRLYSFELAEKPLALLAQTAETYMERCLHHKFRTAEYL